MNSPSEPNVSELTFTDDGWDIHSAMINRGGLSSENVRTLIDSDATKASIESAINWLDAKENENTLIVFSFSGHGGQTPGIAFNDEADGYDEFIAHCDATLTNANIILNGELDEWLSRLESEQIVVVIDSCNSAGMIDLTESEQLGQESAM